MQGMPLRGWGVSLLQKQTWLKLLTLSFPPVDLGLPTPLPGASSSPGHGHLCHQPTGHATTASASLSPLSPPLSLMEADLEKGFQRCPAA